MRGAKVCVFLRCCGKGGTCSSASEASFGVMASQEQVVIVANSGAKRSALAGKHNHTLVPQQTSGRAL